MAKVRNRRLPSSEGGRSAVVKAGPTAGPRAPVTSGAGAWPRFFHNEWIRDGALVLVVANLLLLLRIDPAAEYAWRTEFLNRSDFFQTFAARPAGLVEYASAFCAQMNFSGLYSSLLFSGILLVLLVCARGVLRELRVNSAVPAVLLVILVVAVRGRYNGRWADLALGWALGSVIFLALRSLGRRCPFGLMLLFGLGCGLATGYVAGLWPALSLAVLLVVAGGLPALPEAAATPDFNRPRLSWGRLACLALAICSCALLVLLLPAQERHRWFQPWMNRPTFWLCLGAYLLLPAWGVIAALFARAGFAGGESRVQKGASRGRTVLRVFGYLLGLAVAWFAVDLNRKALGSLEIASASGRHEEVIAAAYRARALNTASEIRLHRALYHLGRLSEDLFSFTNRVMETPLPPLDNGLPGMQAQAETLFELGLVNDAEHYAHEALELEGAHPEILRLLADINTVKNRPKAARVFLNVLAQVPFQQKEAKARLESLLSDPQGNSLTNLSLVRSRMLTNDLPHEGLPAEPLLVLLPHYNPRNRMAFEYLMLHLLLGSNLEKAVNRLSQLDSFGYTRIPRHYEEALLLYQTPQGLAGDSPGTRSAPGNGPSVQAVYRGR